MVLWDFFSIWITDYSIAINMKLLYTKTFKDAIKDQYRRITLGKYKLRGGFNTELSELTPEGIEAGSFSETASPTWGYYDAEFVRYGDGLQISFDIPIMDSSLYTEIYYYQVMLFYFTDHTKELEEPKINLAFILFKDYSLNPSSSEIDFSGLELVTHRNIITIPKFSCKCNLDFYQGNFTSFLENPWGQETRDVEGVGKENYDLKKKNFASVKSWIARTEDSYSEEKNLEWLETSYINKFGLKIY